jgi:hypothetical protein
LQSHLALRFGRSLVAYLEEPARTDAWNRRLIELNHGVEPEPTVAATLYLDHAFSEERMARFMTKVARDPAVVREISQFLRRSLQEKAVERALQAWVRRLSADAELRRLCTALLLELVGEQPDPAKVTTIVDAFYGSRVLLDATTDLVQAILGDPEVIRHLDDTATTLAQLPSLRVAADELLDGW